LNTIEHGKIYQLHVTSIGQRMSAARLFDLAVPGKTWASFALKRAD
jgi:hypothetical protein